MSHVQDGFSLFETLLALCFLSISVLGIARLDILSLHAYYLAYQKSVATAQLVSMIQRLKANYPRRSEEVLLWNAQNKMLLPNGQGTVNCDEHTCTLHLNFGQGAQFLSTVIQNPSRHGTL